MSPIFKRGKLLLCVTMGLSLLATLILWRSSESPNLTASLKLSKIKDNGETSSAIPNDSTASTTTDTTSERPSFSEKTPSGESAVSKPAQDPQLARASALQHKIQEDAPKNNRIENLESVLHSSRIVTGFAAGENPAVPGCAEGSFQPTREGPIYKVRLFLSAIPPHPLPVDFPTEGWGLGTSSYLEITADNGGRWTSAYGESAAFILKNASRESGYLFNVEDSFVLQLFPSKQLTTAYIGNVYSKTDNQEKWIFLSEMILSQPRICTGK